MNDASLHSWISTELIESVLDVQRQSGRKQLRIDPETVPLRDLADFDSVNATEACVHLSKKIGVKVPVHLFATRSGRPLPISDIASSIVRQLGPRLRARVPATT